MQWGQGSRIRAVWAGLELPVIFLLLTGWYFSAIQRVEYHMDEADWVLAGGFTDSFLAGNFYPTVQGQLRFYLLIQPPLTRYIAYTGVRLGGWEVTPLNPMAYSYHASGVAQSLHPQDMVWWARMPFALLAALASVVWYRLMRNAFGRGTALVYTLATTFSPFMTNQLARAMSETPLYLTSGLVLTGLARAVRSARLRDWVLCAGLVGLAATAKLTGVLWLLPTLVLMSLPALSPRLDRLKLRRLVFRSVPAVLLTALASFILLNPFLYPDPLNRTAQMVKIRLEETHKQAFVLFPEYRVDGPAAWARIVPQRIFVDYAPVPSPIGGVIYTALGLWGGIALVRRHPLNPAGLAWLSGVLVILPEIFPLIDWDRYYMLPVVWLAGLFSLGFSAALAALWRRMQFLHKLLLPGNR